jgi:hypothetical protein
MALGIGANTALFSVLDAVVLKSLPVRDPDRLVVVSLRNAHGDRIMGFSYPLYSELRARNQALTGILATTWGGDRMPVRVPPAAEVEGAVVNMVSGDFFEVLGVQPAIGRGLAAGDQPPGAHPVAVLSDRYWRTRFGASPSVVGRSVFIQDVSVTVVGVAPRGFYGSVVGELPDIWVPATMQPQLWPGRAYLNASTVSWLLLMGRLRAGVSLAQAQGDLERTFQQIQRDWQPTPKRKALPENAAIVLMPVMSQIALSLLLVAGAGLFVRTLQNLRSFDTGFDRQHVLMLRIDPRTAGYSIRARKRTQAG